MRRVGILLIIIGLSLMPARAGASALSDAAAKLAPGAWVEITTANQQSILIRSNGGDQMEYGNKMYWDPGPRQMFFCGASHHGSFSQDCVKYNDDANSWSSIGLFAGGSGPDPISHTYDNSAGDPTRGYFYHHAYNSLTTYRYTIRTGSWSSLPAFNMVSDQSLQCCISIVYAPNLDRLIRCTHGEHTLLHGESSNAWGAHGTDIGSGAYHTPRPTGRTTAGTIVRRRRADAGTVAQVNGSRAVSAGRRHRPGAGTSALRRRGGPRVREGAAVPGGQYDPRVQRSLEQLARHRDHGAVPVERGQQLVPRRADLDLRRAHDGLQHQQPDGRAHLALQAREWIGRPQTAAACDAPRAVMQQMEDRLTSMKFMGRGLLGLVLAAILIGVPTVTVTSGATSADQDFANRCAAPGVVRCWVRQRGGPGARAGATRHPREALWGHGRPSADPRHDD
jgi:hypothetical protein